MSSKTDKRAREILQLLLTHGKTAVEDLAGRFGTSPASVRRDLARLEEHGLVHRTHGGAMLAEQAVYEPFRFDASFRVREDRFAPEKLRIASAAAELVQSNETIGFTAGTTTAQVASRLRTRSKLRIVTNAVNIAMELGSSNGVSITLTGGSMRWPGAFSLVGQSAVDSLQATVMDRVYLGVCGIHPEFGATIIEPDEAAVSRAMAQQARQVIVVADSSKVGMISPAVICPATAIDILITDEGITEDAAAAFTSTGIRVISV